MNKTHGMEHTRFYSIYTAIKQRCNNSKIPNYKNYGDRGIKCLWKSFKEFRDDMYESYLEHVKEFGKIQTTINRIDNNENYCSENCRWATYSEQMKNKRNTRIIMFNGKTQCLKDWAKEYSIKREILAYRLNNNWSIEKALTLPAKIGRNQFS